MVSNAGVSLSRAALTAGESTLRFCRLLITGRVHQPGEHVGGRLTFANGSSSRAFRELTVDGQQGVDPAVVVVEYRLRRVRGRMHRLYERLSVLITPMIAGLPGLVSKLWLAHDENDVYRSIYEWNDFAQAVTYAPVLSRLLEVLCVPDSVAYHIVRGQTRSEYLAECEELVAAAAPVNLDAWWRVS